MTMRRRLTYRAFRIRRALVVGLALIAYLIGAVGVPMPVRAQKASATPFPCQNHICGCTTAEQCWRHCCCFSPEEKLAWARTHQVEPPAHEQETAAVGWNQPRLRDQQEGAEAKQAKASC